MASKEIPKIGAISACFAKVKDAVNALIDAQKPWNKCVGKDGIKVDISEANVCIKIDNYKEFVICENGAPVTVLIPMKRKT